jgi:23S rRNA pseudouridine955/2504/2580 synthase
MSGVETVIVGANEGEQRLDRWFKRRYPALGHGRLEKLLRTGQIRLDGKRAKAGDRVAPGQAVRVPPLKLEAPPPPRPRPALSLTEADRKDLKRWTLYRDDRVLVIDKPAGLPVQGGTKSERNLDALLAAAADEFGARPLLVHRLDRDTSGVLVLALDPGAAAALAPAFRDKRARKLYWALVAGAPERDRATIDLALAKRFGAAGERVVALGDDEYEDKEALEEMGGRRARSRYAVLDRAAKELAFVALEPLTGRTHQLRVHMAAIGTPILGDGKYGGPAAFPRIPGLFKGLHLHARRIVVPHPKRGIIDVTAPLPEKLRGSWKSVGFDPDAPADLVDAV